MSWDSKYFTREEFACKCGCGKDDISLKLVKVLDRIREHFGVPVIVTSGCRCKEYNIAVGGRPLRSPHLTCVAADIVVKGVPPKRVADFAECLGVDGLGRYPHFTHVDVRGYKARWGSN